MIANVVTGSAHLAENTATIAGVSVANAHASVKIAQL